MMQAAMKELLKAEGLDLAVMPCCIVNQSSLTIDARNPVQLAESLEKLVGTWAMRQKLQELESEISAMAAKEGSFDEKRSELAAKRLKLRPEVDKLLRCKELHTELQATHGSALQDFVQRAADVQVQLDVAVRWQRVIPLSCMHAIVPHVQKSCSMMQQLSNCSPVQVGPMAKQLAEAMAAERSSAAAHAKSTSDHSAAKKQLTVQDKKLTVASRASTAAAAEEGKAKAAVKVQKQQFGVKEKRLKNDRAMTGRMQEQCTALENTVRELQSKTNDLEAWRCAQTFYIADCAFTAAFTSLVEPGDSM
jgi:chromosome segregation ATPase